MKEALEMPLSSFIFSFPCFFPVSGWSYLVYLNWLALVHSLPLLLCINSFQALWPFRCFCWIHKGQGIENNLLCLSPSLFPLHAFLLPSVTFLLLLYPFSRDLTGISLGNGLRLSVLLVSRHIQIVAWEPGNSRKEQGMKKTRGKDNNRWISMVLPKDTAWGSLCKSHLRI